MILLGGEPFPEPIIMWWNFVARTRDEIDAAHASWTAQDDRTIRKLTVRVAFDVPEDVRSRADGLRSGTLDVTLTLTDVGKNQLITAPKDAKPIADAAGALQGLFGSLGAAATGGIVSQ